MPEGLKPDELAGLDAWWRAANYLTVGQIYLQSNPLLREPLKASDIKPRLLGHWGTSPGLSLLYAHLNRLIRARDLNAIYLAGPGHGGPALLANVYLEGAYSDIYPAITQDEEGMRRLFRQFSTPGGVPSHVGPPTPGSIHEGGELGYVLSHAFGAAFDNPDLTVIAVVGDGEAETGPLEGSWKGISFLNPARDGAVLPVLHLNGYKISGPTVLGRAGNEEIRSLLQGHGYEVHFVEGEDPPRVHRELASALESCLDHIKAIQGDARRRDVRTRPRWPVLVLRTPKGWTGPKVVDGVQIEGTFRAHQVPLSEVRSNPAHLKLLEAWMRSYRPEELFDAKGQLLPALAALAPKGDRRMGANPHANGGKRSRPLELPDYASYALPVPRPGQELRESTRQLGLMLRDTFTLNKGPANFRLFCPDETNSNRLGAVFEVENRCSLERATPADDHLSPDGRVMEVLSEHNCQGWLEGYLLTGRHGLFATYEAFALIVASMATQHAKWLEACLALPWRAPVPSLNYLLTSTCWRNDHNGFSHQGPGFMDTIISKKGTVARVYLPPDANCLLSVADHCLRSKSYVNLIIIDKQPEPQWLDLESARAHCARGASIWHWASQEDAEGPDVVMACAGDVPTLETLAAVDWLRERAPDLKVRVVNVVDLMRLAVRELHPHGMPDEMFAELFTSERDVIFAFHGYPGAIHQLVHRRQHPERFHVRGYNEEGTTTTPFDMVVLNEMSRYHLALEALRRARRRPPNAQVLMDECYKALERHRLYIREHLEDLPEIFQLEVGRMNLLCLNSGSSSLKFAVLRFAAGKEEKLLSGAVEALDGTAPRMWVEALGAKRRDRPAPAPGIGPAVTALLACLSEAGLPRPDGVGHRFVHGGPRHFRPERISPALLASLRGLIPYAPLHLPAELRAVELLAEQLPGTPQVVCFDTAFHQHLPELAQRFPFDRALFEAGVRRYGFHGISYEYLVQHLGAALGSRALLAHLGSGASMAAVRDGACIETTMGFGPTGGFMMGSRSGDLDPSVLIHLLRTEAGGVDRLEQRVNREAGLRGVSGISGDMKSLLAQREANPDARMAVEMFCYHAAKSAGALTVALGGLDALVFTGGVGEHAAPVREAICDRLAHLGVVLDRSANERHAPVVSASTSRVRVLVQETDEDLVIARHVQRLLEAGGGSASS